MIEKNSPQYKQAQEVANKIVRVASYERWNNQSLFNIYIDKFPQFLSCIQNIDCFAAKIATTINDKINPYGARIAFVSDKQAWILACAAVENKIEFN
jgi:hypothetical protein